RALRQPEAPLHRQVQDDLAWLAAQPQAQVITWADAAYPPLLRQIADPPPLLFVIGDPALLARPQIALVGSRQATRGGTETAFAFARALAAAGLAVTSGLAHGIDGAAHRGALAAEGHTLAVMATGPDNIYPRAHRDLAAQILAGGGALVSEFPPGTRPLAGLFPRRNRIIAGLSMGVLVAE